MAIETHWVWDKFPLDAGTWGNASIANDAKPGHEFIRLGKVTYRLTTADGQKRWPTQKKRWGYRPDENDLAILTRAFPDADPYDPSWAKVRQHLVVEGGQTIEKLVTTDVTVLLGLLDKVTQPKPATSPQLPLVDQIEQLINDVDHCLTPLLRVYGLEEGYTPANEQQRLEDEAHDQAKLDSEAAARQLAITFIKNKDSNTPDPKPLLALANAIQSGDGKKAEAVWENLKLVLQEYALILTHAAGPTAAPMTDAQRVDELDKQVTRWLSSIYEHRGIRSVGDTVTQDDQRIHDDYEHARQQVVDLGDELAVELVNQNADAIPLLELVDMAKDDDSEAAKPKWRSVKVMLNQWVMQQANRSDDEGEKTANPSQTSTPDAPKKTAKDVEAYLVGYAGRGDPYKSQKAFAKQLDVSPATINKAINGNRILREWKQANSKPAVTRFNEVTSDRTRQNTEKDPLEQVSEEDELASLIREQQQDDRSDYSHSKL